jgi:FkbM family methyltransferase
MNNFYAYLGNNTGFTTLNNGVFCYVDTSDASIAPHLIFSGEWEMLVTNYINNTFPGGVFFDLGCNFGYFSLLVGHRAKEVHAFDANPRMCSLLDKSSRLNGWRHKFKINNLAIADKEGQGRLRINTNFMGSSAMEATMYNGQDVSVELTTIDKYCKLHGISSIDYMKVDIEGYEDKALLEVITPIQQLVLEFAPARYKNPKEFFNILRARYKTIRDIEHDAVITTYETIKLQNGLFQMLYFTDLV